MNWKTYSYNDGERLARERGIYDDFVYIISDFDIQEYHGMKKKWKPYLHEKIKSAGWEDNVKIDPLEKATLFIPTYIKERVGLDIMTYHSTKIGTQFLKFEIISNKHLGYVDFGVMLSFTKELQKILDKKYEASWSGSITYEQIKNYLVISSSIISVPLLIIGIDL